jgi:quercetin dioxygenase-like cupin family protein
MIRRALLSLVALAAAMPGAALAQSAIPERTPMAILPVTPGKLVSRVETTRVAFQPGQAMPTHSHTVPVVCFVTKGDFLVSIADRPERRVAQGGVTFEGPGEIVHYFKNASATAPAELTCASLAGSDDKVLNVMLDQTPSR